MSALENLSTALSAAVRENYPNCRSACVVIDQGPDLPALTPVFIQPIARASSPSRPVPPELASSEPECKP